MSVALQTGSDFCPYPCIVIVHLNPALRPLPPFVWASIRESSGHGRPVNLITQKPHPSLERTGLEYGRVRLHDVKPYERSAKLRRFLLSYRPITAFGNGTGWYHHVMKRWYVLEQFVVLHALRGVLNLDTDAVLLRDVRPIVRSLVPDVCDAILPMDEHSASIDYRKGIWSFSPHTMYFTAPVISEYTDFATWLFTTPAPVHAMRSRLNRTGLPIDDMATWYLFVASSDMNSERYHVNTSEIPRTARSFRYCDALSQGFDDNVQFFWHKWPAWMWRLGLGRFTGLSSIHFQGHTKSFMAPYEPPK